VRVPPCAVVSLALKLAGVTYVPETMEAALIDAAWRALGLASYPKNIIHVIVGLGSRRRGLLQADPKPVATQSKFNNGGQRVGSVQASAAAEESVVRIEFPATPDYGQASLIAATAPTTSFLPFLRNYLPSGWFPSGGFRFHACGYVRALLPVLLLRPLHNGAGGSVCGVDSNGACQGTVYTIVQTIATCKVDVCFLMDGSGSMSDASWEVEANVVDNIARIIGDDAAYVAVVEFSDGTYTHVPPTKKSSVDTSTLRTARQFTGLTYMGEAIRKCQSILTQDLMFSSPTRHAKVIVLLTDGAPNGVLDPVTEANAAKLAGTTIITVGVGGADLALLDTLSNGAGYAYSADAFNNDATNLGTQITPALCSATPSAGECACVCQSIMPPFLIAFMVRTAQLQSDCLLCRHH